MIPDIIPVNNWRGNSYATEFDFDFLINSESELKVLHTNANGYQTVLKLNIDYMINRIGNPNGSSIVFPISGSEYSVLTEDETISLVLNIPTAQTTSFGTSAVLNLSSLEYALDYIVRLIQIQSRIVERCVKVQEGENIEPDELIENIKTSENNALISANNSATNAELSQSFATVASNQKNIVIETADAKIQEIITTTNQAFVDMTEIKNETLNIKNETEEIKNEVAETLSSKANTDLSNVDSKIITNYCQPDFNAGVLKAIGEDHTAPCDGIIVFMTADYNTASNLFINGNGILVGGTSNGQLSNVFTSFPIPKGTVYKLITREDGSGAYLTFYPLKGAV